MWLNLELTVIQQSQLEQMKRSIGKLTRQELEGIALDAIRQSYGYRNAFRSIAKDKL